MNVTPDTGPVHAYEAADVTGYAEDITSYLALWAGRGGNRGTPEQREAAKAAMDAIDGLTRQLHALRSQLVGEIRAYDDETARRTDALLAEYRAERESALDRYDRQAHLAWYAENSPVKDCWPPYPRTDVTAARYIADYSGAAS